MGVKTECGQLPRLIIYIDWYISITPFILLKDGGVILGMEPMNVDVGLVIDAQCKLRYIVFSLGK